MLQRRASGPGLPWSRKEAGFLEAGEQERFQSFCKNWELINDTAILKKDLLPIRPVKTGKQLTIKTDLEDLQSEKRCTAEALVDSGCMKTCIDETFARLVGLTLTRIPKLIWVEYADRTSVKGSTIRYVVNLQIRAAGSTVATGALVTRLKSAKIFLGFDWLQAVNPRINWTTLQVQMEDGVAPMQMRNIEETPDYKEQFSKVFSADAF
jgi:hypothetical protein